MLAKKYAPPHPIMFIMDYTNKGVNVPEYDPVALVSNNDTCISVRTIASVDGDVTVVLADGLPADAQLATRVFAGTLDVPSGKVAVVSSENEKLLELGVVGTRALIDVFVDDTVYPSAVWVVAGSAVTAP